MPALTCLPQTIHLHPNQTLPVKCTLTVLILDCTFLPNAPVCIYIWTNCDPQNVVKSGKYVYACMRRMTSMQGKSLAGLGGTQTPDTLLSKQSSWIIPGLDSWWVCLEPSHSSSITFPALLAPQWCPCAWPSPFGTATLSYACVQRQVNFSFTLRKMTHKRDCDLLRQHPKLLSGVQFVH